MNLQEFAESEAKKDAEQRNTVLGATLRSTRGTPESYAQDMILARRAGVPVETAERNKEMLEEEQRARDWQKLIEDNPRLTGKAVDPEFVGVASDSAPQLNAFAKATRDFFSGGKRRRPVAPEEVSPRGFSEVVRQMKEDNPGIDWDTARQMAKSAVKVVDGATDLPYGVAPTAANIVGGMFSQAGENFEQQQAGRELMREREQGVDRTLYPYRSVSPLTKYRDSVARNQKNKINFESTTGEAAFEGGVSFLTNTPGTAAGLVTALTASPVAGKAVSLLAAGEATMAQAYAKYADRGATHAEAMAGSLSEGAIEILTELGPVGTLMDMFGSKASFLKLAKKLLVKDLVGEEVATAGQDAVDTLIANPNKTWSEYLSERPEAAYRTAIATLVNVGTMSALHKGAQLALGREVEPDARFSDNLKVLVDQAKLQKVLERDAETFEGFTKSITEEGADKLYVQVETLQEKGVLNQLIEEVPDLAMQVRAALASNGEIEIPVELFLGRLAKSDLAQKLVDDVRLPGDSMSKNEAKEYESTKGAELMAQVERATASMGENLTRDAEQQAIKQEVLNQIIATGRYTRGASEAMADLYLRHVVAITPRSERSIKKYYEMFKPRISELTSKAADKQLLEQRQRGGRLDDIEAFNYGNTERVVLSGANFGRGLPGNGREQYLNAADERLRKRVYFYVDKGTGINPEQGVGGIARRARLSNIYDSNADPLRLKEGRDQLGFESAVLDAGFAGYLDRMDGTQSGQVIMLGDQDIPVEVLGPMARTRGRVVPAPLAREAKGRDVFVDQMRAELPTGGYKTLTEWRDYMAANMPEAAQALAAAGVFDNNTGEKMYRGALIEAYKAATPAESYQQGGRDREVDVTVETASSLESAWQIASERKWPKIRDFKVAIQNAVIAAAGRRNLAVDTPENRKYMVRQLLREAKLALKSNPGAVGWYDEKVSIALEIMSIVHPELASDPQARFAFTWALAVTSNGVKVEMNFKLADKAYEAWKASSANMEDRRFPTSGIGIGAAGGQIDDALATFNHWVGQWGLDKFKEFATKYQLNRDVKSATGRQVSGEGLDTMLFGAGIVGPKIGNGFFMNLYGEFGQLTMDRWWVRLWGRLTADLVDYNPAAIRASRDSFVGLIEYIKQNPEATKAIEDALGARLGKANPAEMAQLITRRSSKPEFRDALREVLPGEAHVERLTALRGKLKDYISVGDELRKAAKNYLGTMDGQIETPGASSRRDMMRAIAAQVHAELVKEHPQLTMADFQALMWYPEKRLYESASDERDTAEGYEDGEAPDYANAAIALAREKGVADEKINEAVSRAKDAVQARGRAATSGRGDVGPGVPPSQGTLKQAGDGSGRQEGGELAPLEGAPVVEGATGPDPALVAVADSYARSHGIDLRRQANYVEVDPDFGARLAAAYEAMQHDPGNPIVRASYDALIRETIAQYQALVDAGYSFWFYDQTNDPYDGNPFHAMRDLRATKSMGVFATEAGYGNEINDSLAQENLLVVDTGLEWPWGSPTGPMKRVTANDLFRAVHDAFGHGLEGAGFRARGEANAFEAHARMFSPAAQMALANETRAQNSWLNFSQRPLVELLGEERAKELHPDSWETITVGEHNATARVEDTVFADQKNGILPEWAWTEGRAEDMAADTLEQPARGEYHPPSRTISLLTAANLSTFHHELAHHFLEVLTDIANEPNPPAEIAEMVETALKWMGITSQADQVLHTPPVDAPAATFESFTPKNIRNLMNTAGWAIFTSENPNGKAQTPEANAAARDALKADLDAMGLQYLDAIGRYGDNMEKPFVVIGITEDQVNTLTAKYGQNSALINRGLMMPNGQLEARATGKVTKYTVRPKDNYTEIPSLGVMFSAGMTFRQEDGRGGRAPLAPVEVSTSEKTGNTKKSYEVFDEDGTRLTINIIRKSDGSLFRIFSEGKGPDGKNVRGELSPGYGDGVSDDQIVRGIAEAQDLTIKEDGSYRQGENQRNLLLDADGKLLKVYHGTHTPGIDAFAPGRAGAIYFSPRRQHAVRYGPNVAVAHLSVEKLADLTDPESEAYKLAVATFNKNGGWSGNEDAMEGRTSPDFDPAQDLTWEIFDWPEANIQEALLAAGYDGFKLQEYNGEVSYAVTRPDQVVRAATGNRGTYDPNDPNILNQSPWYSALQRAIGSSPTKAAPAQGWKDAVKGWVAKGLVKQDEVDAVGLIEYLDTLPGKITREQVFTFIEQNGVQVEEVTLGSGGLTPAELHERADLNDRYMLSELGEDVEFDGGDFDRLQELEQNGERPGLTKFDNPSWRPPGGDPATYREMVFTLPQRGDAAARAKRLSEIADEMVDTTPERYVELHAERAALADEYRANQDEGFRSSHWDQPNVLAHTRLIDSTDADGNRVLNVIEIQSDWGQKGRDEGFANAASEKHIPQVAPGERRELIKAIKAKAVEKLVAAGESESTARTAVEGMGNDLAARAAGMMNQYMDLISRETEDTIAEQKAKSAIPTAPFVTNTSAWTALVLKRVVKLAVDEGYDKVVISTGQEAADMFDLSKQIDHIDYRQAPPSDDTYDITAVDKNGLEVLNESGAKLARIEELVGKEVAQKIANGEGQRGGGRTTLRGLDLKVGGEGMKAFYDKIVPSVLKDVLKKVGGKVETVFLPDPEGTGRTMPGGRDPVSGRAMPEIRIEDEPPLVRVGFTITDEMRRRVEGGMPLFQGEDAGGGPPPTPPLGRTRLETWNMMTFLEREPYHEKFARGFEAYLLEGKAPSVEMRTVFQRFREWIIGAYKGLRQAGAALGVKLDDEIRSVYDRLIASDEEIEQARAMDTLGLMFPTREAAVKAGMDWDEYRKLQEAQIEAAQEALQTKTMGEMKWLSNAKSRALRSLQREAAEQRREVRMTVRREMMEQPLYQVWVFLTATGEDTGRLKGLDAVEVAGPEVTKAVRARGMVEAEGLHPDMVADRFGFESGSQMMNALADAPTLEEAIREETDRRMLADHSELATPEAIAEAVDAAISNKHRARMATMELNALERMLGTGRKGLTQAKLAAQFAANQVKNTLVRNLNPQSAKHAEARAARASLAAHRKGDIAEAARQKRNEVVNAAVVKAIHDAKEEVRRTLEFFKRIDKPGARKSRRGEYLAQRDALLARFDLRQSRSLKDIDARKQTLAAWVESESERLSAIMPDLPSWILDEVYKKSYKEMTVEELAGLRSAVEQLDMLARREHKQYTAIRDQSFGQEKAALLAGIRKHYPDAFDANGEPKGQEPQHVPSMAKSISELEDGFTAEWVQWEHVALMLDGGTIGPMWESVFGRLTHGSDWKAERIHQLFKDIKPLLQGQYSLYERRNFGRKDITSHITGLPAETRENVLVIALLNGSAEGRQRLSNYGWTPTQIQQMIDLLDVRDIKLANAIWKMFDQDLWPESKALNERTVGKAPPKVEAVPTKAAAGELTGGYFPVKYDHDLDERVHKRNEAATLADMMGGDILGMSAKPRRSASNERVETTTLRPLLTLNVMSLIVNETVHDIAYREAVADAMRILNDTSIQNAIKGAVGLKTYRAMVEKVRRTAAPPLDPMGWLDRSLTAARKNTVVVLMSGAMTALQNVTGLFPAAFKVGGLNLAVEAAKMATVYQMPERIRFALSRSAYMRELVHNYERDVHEAIRSLSVNGKTMPETAHMLFLMGWINTLVAVPVWNAAFKQGMDMHANDVSRAVDHANSTVRQTQSSGRKLDLALIADGGPVRSVFTMFYSYASGMLSYLVQVGAVSKQMARDNPAQAALYFTTGFLMVHVLPTIATELLMRGLEGDDEDQVERWAKVFGRSFAGYVPIVRDIYAFGVSHFDPNARFNGNLRLSPIEAAYEGIFKGFRSGYELAQGEGDMKDVKGAIMGAGFMFGIPGKLIADVVTGTAAFLEGEAGPQAILVGPPRKPQ